MKYLLVMASLFVSGVSIYGAILRDALFDRCLFIASAVVSLIVGIYGLYANNKRDKRIKYLEENGMTARVEGATLVFDKIK